MDFRENEERDGVRLPWNNLPFNAVWAEKIVLPVGVIYSPAKNITDLEFLGDKPVACNSCNSVLNPYCAIDLNSKSYQCSVCGARNGLPQAKLKQLAEQKTLPESKGQNTTIEYLVDENPRERGFIFLVDKCVPEDELEVVKASILGAVQNLSDDTYVALISFDRNVFVYDLEETEFLEELAINGSKDYDHERISKLLQFVLPAAQAVHHKPSEKLDLIYRKLETSRPIFEKALSSIKVDRWTTAPGERPYRCSGAALKVAVTMAMGWFQHVDRLT